MFRSLLLICLCLMQTACAHTQVQSLTPAGPGLSRMAKADYHFLMYEEFLRQNRIEEARESLRRALEMRPSPQLYIELANTSWQENDPNSARKILKEAIRIYPDHLGFYRSLASIYLAENRLDEATVTLQEYYRNNPLDRQVVKELAAVLIQDRDYARAKDILSSFPRDDFDEQLYFLLAKTCTGLGLRSRAIEHLTAATRLNQEYLDAWIELGYLHELEKDFSSALAVYQKLNQLGEESEEILLRLISLNLKLNDPDKALSIVAENSLSNESLVEVAHEFLSEEFFSHAQDIILLIQEEGEASSQMHFLQALLFLEKDEDPGKSLATLEKIPADDPLYPQALEFRIQLLVQLDKTGEAGSTVELGQSLFPQNPAFWLLEAAVAEQNGLNEKAVDILEDAVNRFPEDVDLLYQKGVLYEKQDKRNKAMQVMEAIISKNPDHVDALNFLGYTLADLGRDLDRALVLVQNAVRSAPDNGYIVDSLAWVYFKKGDLDRAWQEIQKAVSLVESDPIIWEHYGDIAQALDETAKARTAYEKALLLKPSDPESIRSKLDRM